MALVKKDESICLIEAPPWSDWIIHLEVHCLPLHGPCWRSVYLSRRALPDYYPPRVTEGLAHLEAVGELLAASAVWRAPRYQLNVFGSDNYFSWWQPPGASEPQQDEAPFGQVEAVSAALRFVRSTTRGN